jgi:hypothetical protein
MNKNFDEYINQKEPSYIQILLSRHFYRAFLEGLRENILYEILIFSLFFMVGLATKDYKYPIIAICLYIFQLFLLNAYKFKTQVQILIYEEAAKLMKDKDNHIRENES